MSLKNVFLFVTALLLMGCGSKKDLNSVSTDIILLGTKWRIVELSGKIIKDKVNDKAPYLSFDSK